MNLALDLPADLEAILEKRASQARFDIPAYALLALRAWVFPQDYEPSISNEQFEASLSRLQAIHVNAPAQFDDNRESIY